MFGGQAKPGKMSTVLRVVSEQSEKVKTIPGFLFAQVLQNGDEMLVVSSWRTERDVRTYMHSALAQETLTRLAPLLVCAPTVKTFPIHLSQVSQVSQDEESFEDLVVLCCNDEEADQPVVI
jgi:heme-degrading monooxygenase HmoA